MTVFIRSAAALAMVASLGAVAHAQTANDRPSAGQTLYEGRSVLQEPAAPREGQIVMGLRVPGSGPLAGPAEAERR